MVGTEEKGVIWHFGIKYDKYFIFLCKFFYFSHILRKVYMTTVTQDFAKLCHICLK